MVSVAEVTEELARPRVMLVESVAGVTEELARPGVMLVELVAGVKEGLAQPAVVLVELVAVWTNDVCRPECGLALHGCSGCSSNVRIDNWRHDVCGVKLLAKIP
eukprot:3007916-Rhodomonas_salina.1